MKALVTVILAVLLALAAFGDTGDAGLKFEISDVHASHPSPVQSLTGPFIRGGRYEARYATMVDLVALAYGVDNDKVFGGPTWLEMEYYDVIAKPPAGTSKDKLKLMLQNLLADRFQLKVHPGSKPMPAFALVVGKHPSLKKSDGAKDPDCKFIQPDQPKPGESANAMPLFLNQCHNMTMDGLAHRLGDMPASFFYLSGKTVVDKTGLEGAYDFDIAYNGRMNNRGGVATQLVTMADAIDKLGLKLEASTIPFPGIVVESVERTPAPNQPGAAEALHTFVPTEFEVAALQPTDADFHGTRFDIQPGGRVNLQGVTAKILVQQSFNLSDEMLAGAPAWFDSDRWDIVAKAQTVESADPRQTGGDIDFNAVMIMVQNLLKDRFKFSFHYEDRPVEAYTLLPGKSKMKPADPNSRISCNEGPGPDGKDPRNEHPGLSRLLYCQNMTMDVFAGQLQRLAGGYVHVPVINSSKLDGAWDFTLSFSTAGQFQNGSKRPDSDKPDSDLPDVMSLPEAVARQMGLRFELQKRPVPVLVIDHIERKPVE